jgi:DNA end-binding protein Ku
MPRAIWKGTIAFGLVNIPVSLYSADRRSDIQLHLLDRRNHARVRYERVNAETGEEVPWDTLVKGYEYEKDHYVLLTDEDIQAVSPKLSKTIAIDDFVALAEIDPMLFDKPYFLEPDTRGQRAYVLLRETLKATGRAGIAKVVIRTREYLTALFVRGEALVLMLLRFPEELRTSAELKLPATRDTAPKPRELELATQLVESMSTPWQPERYHDDYHEALIGYIEEKLRLGQATEGPPLRQAEAAEEPGKVVDLVGYLQRSLAQATSESATQPTDAKPAKPQPKPAAKPDQPVPAKPARPRKRAHPSPPTAKKQPEQDVADQPAPKTPGKSRRRSA